MTIELKKMDGVLHVELSGELAVGQASAIYADLASLADGDTTVVLDAAKVERVDTSIAQLVYALSRHVMAFHTEAASPAWWSAWKNLGLPHSLLDESRVD